jgi:TonB family protein
MSEEAIDKKILIAGEQDSRRTLLLGFGCSVFLHGSTALAVSQLWHPAEEIIEITLVEPVEEPPQPSPVVAIKPTPSARPSLPVKVAVVKSPSPTLPPSVQPTPLRSRPIEVAKKNTPSPTPQPTQNLPRPTPTPPEQVVTRKRQDNEKEPIPADSSNGKSGGSRGSTNQGSLAASTTQPNRVALDPTPDQQSGKENSSGGESASDQPQELEMGGEPGNIAGVAGADNSDTPADSNQSSLGNSGSRSSNIGSAIASTGGGLSSGDDAFGGESNSLDRGGNIASGGNSDLAGNNQGGLGVGRSRASSLTDALGAGGNRDGLDGDNLTSFSPGDTSKIARDNIAPSPENSGKPPPRCIKNCNITDIKIGASDSGKDKIIIRAKIDGNGIVLAANIHRSSGNSDLDRLILKATQKMEFYPTGITDVYKIKHNLYSQID